MTALATPKQFDFIRSLRDSRNLSTLSDIQQAWLAALLRSASAFSPAAP